MKVVLIALPLSLGGRYTEFGGVQYPINVGYLASYLIKNGYDVEMWDYNVEPFTEKGFAERVRKSNASVIGIHSKTPTILIAGKLAKIIKGVNKNIRVIVGGPHCTALPERTLKEFPQFDVCVCGEGEETLLELCDRIKNNQPVNGTLGIAYRAKESQKKMVVVEPKRSLIKNLDDLPFPNRDLISQDKYRKAHVERGIPRSVWNVAEIMVSRGCPFQCVYCAGSLNYGNVVRFRSAKNVIKEIEECIEKYGTSYVNINDDTLTLRKDILYGLCSGFKRLGIKWGCLTRVDVTTKEMLKMMVDSGCIRINFGIESGSQRILDLTKKNIRIEQVKKVFRYADEVGLKIKDCGFMVGQHPDETIEDVKKTLKLMKEIKPTFASVTITVPFPGTELNRMMKEKGYLKDEKWENFVMFGKKPVWRTKYFSSDDLVRLQKWVMRKYYFRPGYIIHTLFNIRSINELEYFIDVGLDFLRNVVIKRG